MENKENTIGQLKKQIRELSESNSDLKQQLKTSKENQTIIQTENLIENLPDVIWKTTSDGKTVFISTNVEKILGYTQKEIIGGEISWFVSVSLN